MTEYKIAVATAGKDKGSTFAIVGESDEMILICDGKSRPIERPKKKNPRHLQITDDSLRLEGITNRALRRALKEYADRIALS